jgi:peptidyl-prolyl cis-trans isomerase A (cyclophilin A)
MQRIFTWCLAALFAVAGIAHAQTPPAAKPRVELKTSMGKIVVELDPAHAPITVANFLKYVRSGHYNGTIFHRVIDGFMIQGGGMDAAMHEKTTGAPIKLESKNGLSNTVGTIAMARTNVPDSATAQFFINVVDNSSRLDYPRPDGNGYAVFGKVVAGMEVVEKIKAVRTSTVGQNENVPVQAIVIERATVLQ